MEEGLIYDIKLSSVGPGNPTASDSVFMPENMDLAMKLHYIRFIYYFGSKAFEGLTPLNVKETMFLWLNQFPVPCGRFRRSDSSRPYIKCNDCGVRFLEAKSGKTLDEWLETKDDSLEKALTPNQIVGPELFFSPTVLVQLTKFKCGGAALGVSWAHVLGDAFSATEFMTQLGHTTAGREPGRPITLAQSLTKPIISNTLHEDVEEPLSLKQVDPVGDVWIHSPKCDMVASSFHVSGAQLSHLQSRLSRGGGKVATFEALSALIWQCIARIRDQESGLQVVTICRKGEQNKKCELVGNRQVVSVVKAKNPVVEAELVDLATLIRDGESDERKRIEEAVEKDQGLGDFIIYGANLTFLNFEEGTFYEFEYRGQNPVNVSLRIDGVGEEGVVLVLPGPRLGSSNGGEGRTVTTILPEKEIEKLKSELKSEGILA